MWNRDSSKGANRLLGGTSRGVWNDSVFFKGGEFFRDWYCGNYYVVVEFTVLAGCRRAWVGQVRDRGYQEEDSKKKNNGLVSADPQDLHSLAWSAWPLETIHHTPLEYDFDR